MQKIIQFFVYRDTISSLRKVAINILFSYQLKNDEAFKNGRFIRPIQ
jgi:hypothetical protein